MERKNFEFKAYDSNGKEIDLKGANIFYYTTEEMAEGIRIGLINGLSKKYKDPQVTYIKF